VVTGDRTTGRTTRLVLAYADGRVLEGCDGAFPAGDLLPEACREELRGGGLAVYSLSAGGTEFGYLLYERSGGPSAMASEVLYLGISRALEAVFNTETFERHAAVLEREVDTRRRAEARLQDEVAIRRRAEDELQQANAELQRSLRTDAMTRIANRSAFQEHLDRHWQTSTGSLALLMVDVDQFKAFNDLYGHVLGDETLRVVAACLERAATGSDALACRYGGEEFAVILPDADVAEAVDVAVRIRTLLTEAAIPHRTSTVSEVVTVSIGVAVGRPDRRVSPQHLVRIADDALYEAKAEGRNRVSVADWLGEFGEPPADADADAAGGRRRR